MAISTDYDYDDILSLDKAKLSLRSRLNFLGSKELTLNYNGVASAAREDAVEWLEANRLSITDPNFGYKTYEGTWFCVDISFNEDRSILSQRFKIDSSFEDTTAQKTASGVTAERSYFWRVTDPDNADILAKIPTNVPSGDIYTKTAVDNGDGTYDVTITKETIANLTADSAVQSDSYTESTEVNTNSTEQSFVADGGSVPDAVVGEIKRIDNVPLENGNFRTTVTTQTAIAQRIPATGFITFPGDYSAVGGTLIVAKNKTKADLDTDTALINPSPWVYVLSVSARVNDYGLIDYTISGRI